jgi:hypothetical protein
MDSNFNGPRLKLEKGASLTTSLRGSFNEQADALNQSEDSCADGISPVKDDIPDEFNFISIEL